MGQSKESYFISVLYGECSDSEKKRKLGEKYQQFVKDSTEYRQITDYLNNVAFSGDDGLALIQESKDVLVEALANIDYASETLDKMNSLARKIEKEISLNESRLESPELFTEQLSALRTEVIPRYHSAYRSLANSFCYYLMMLGGASALNGLPPTEGMGLQLLVHSLNTVYADKITSLALDKSRRVWKLSRQLFSGANRFEYTGWLLNYDSIDFYKYAQETGMIRVAPNLYASGFNSDSSVFLVGFGNIVGVDMNKAASVFGKRMVTSLGSIMPKNQLSLFDPIDSLRHLLNTEYFCISPESLASIMDSFELNEVIRERKLNNQCVYCGAEVSNGNECVKHKMRGIN